MTDVRDSSPPAPGLLSIGALSRATAIPVITLRTWERRYGYPSPMRLPSGHRLYDLATVTRLRRIAEALERGHRAGQVVPADDETLDQLLAVTPATRPRAPRRETDPEVLEALVSSIQRCDGEQFVALLEDDLETRDPACFLAATAAPLLDRLDHERAHDRLDVARQQLAHQRLLDVLNRLRTEAEPNARGPAVVVGTLPESDVHAIRLQLTAAALTVSGCRVVNLGTPMPVDEFERAVMESRARAVALSISPHELTEATVPQLELLRARVPTAEVAAEGARAPEGVHGVRALRDLHALEAWAHTLSA